MRLMRRIERCWTVCCLLVLLGGCSLPRDPHDTLKNVRYQKALRVGVSENPPWVTRQGDSAEGIEPKLVEGFAERNGARVEWFWDSVEENIRALKYRELDLVIAGIDQDT